ncbi:MAG: hypothetical protein KDD73_11780 [Anaerolineales bacterium]|nr:hypothetical protein [Anaerolineales bacterium]
MDANWAQIAQWLLMISAISLVLATILGLWLWNRVKRLRIPDSATFIEAMRLTPLSVVVFLDLLDLGLDFFSTPISWVMLSRLGLTKLRGVTALEAIIPGTQVLPTMTVAWLAIRLFGPQLDEIPWLRDRIDREAMRSRPRRLPR